MGNERHEHTPTRAYISHDTVGDRFITYSQGQCKCGVILGSKVETSNVLSREAVNRMEREKRAAAAEARKKRSKD